VKSLSAKLNELKAEHECCLFEENAEDFPSLEADVLGIPTKEGSIEYFMTLEALHSSPEVYVVPRFDDYLDEEKKKGVFLSYLEPISEQPSSGSSQAASTSHPPAFTRDIQQFVCSCVVEKASCYPFSGVFRLNYKLVKEYMELYFIHVLNPPNFILTSTLGGNLKNVTCLLSRLHYLLSSIDRVKALLVRKLLEWLWWKFGFT